MGLDTKIKICGLTCEDDVSLVNKYDVDFVGFVLFFPKSKRNLQIERAKELMSIVKEGIKKVAVVVSPSVDEICQIEAAGFDYIQIHGSMDLDIIKGIKIPVIRAFNVTDMGNYEIYHNCNNIKGYVFDAIEPGSGKVFDWTLVTEVPRDEKMLILAGGLNSENVAAAINSVKPDAVDCSSGVEYTDRQGKDPCKVEAFVRAVRGD